MPADIKAADSRRGGRGDCFDCKRYHT